jgi:anti-sigma regulatory factor (Ser/Thr protein kinase)
MEQLVLPQGLRDDVALVALHNNSEIPAELHLRLPAHPKVLSPLRRAVRRWLRSRGADDEATAEVTLAVSEACANAIEHAYSPSPATFELDARSSIGDVTISVSDVGRRRSPRGQNRGRGLTIVDAAMDDVEVRPNASGTEVLMRRRLHR